MDKYTFGNRLYELRIRNNLTQKQLAMYLGVSNKAVSKWETGEAMPRVKTLQAIAQCFGISFSDLLSETPCEEKLPPYEIYYRNKIEAKELKFIKDSKSTRVFFAFFVFFKILLCFFNGIFVRVNVLYSVFSVAILMLFGVFYYRHLTKSVKNIKTLTNKDLNYHLCYLLIFILHAIIDSVVFYKHDFNNYYTVALHIIPLALTLLFHLIQKKDFSEDSLQFVGALEICLPILFLGMWIVKGTDTMYNYIENLMLLNERIDNSKIYDIFVGFFISILNVLSMAIYGHISINYFYISDIIRAKQIKTSDNDTKNNKHTKMMVLFCVVAGSGVMIWIFFLLFKFFDLV